jgi:hypothetical protein
LNLIQSDSIVVEVIIPEHVEFGIGTWFNRAVMSSQAFSRILNAMGIRQDQEPSVADTLKLRAWLANGMERPLPDFIDSASTHVGSIYHLKDMLWVIPALKTAMTRSVIGLVYDAKIVKKDGKPKTNSKEAAIKILRDVQFFVRNKTAIMHNKFLIAGENLLSTTGGKPIQLTCGSMSL